MKDVLLYIEENIENDFSNKLLADVAGYSEFHFIKKFKEQNQCTPMEYVWRRKLVRATDEIAAGRKIVDIAFQYGFHSQSAFDKAFRRTFGISPSFLKSIRMGIDEMNNTANMIFLNKIQEGTPKEELFSMLKQILERNKIAWDEELTERMYRLSCKVFDGKRRYSGEEFVIHPLNVACILAEMEVDVKMILAALFVEVDKNGNVPLETLKEEIPAEIFALAAEVQDNTRDMRSQSEDVVLIRLAHRLHNLRTMQHVNEETRAKKIKETIEVYLPIARLLENQQLMDELNDLTMKWA